MNEIIPVGVSSTPFIPDYQGSEQIDVARVRQVDDLLFHLTANADVDPRILIKKNIENAFPHEKYSINNRCNNRIL